ncbi:MAG: hypothetical protein WDN46_22450 [Methylocella sp.]
MAGAIATITSPAAAKLAQDLKTLGMTVSCDGADISAIGAVDTKGAVKVFFGKLYASLAPDCSKFGGMPVAL